MKGKSTTILSVVAVLVTVLCITGPAGASPLARPNLQSGAPTVVSYQGQVTVGGTPYDGDGYFKFAVVNATGKTYWSNDGTSEGGGEPTYGVSLTVTDGLFNVLLGDTSVHNMTQPLTATVFADTDRYLRVWFSEDDDTYEQLSPDRRIAAMPYALQAQEAAYAADAGMLDGQDGAYYQARVSGACAVGSTVRAINPDGTVVCQAGALLNRSVAPTGNVTATIQSLDVLPGNTSVTIGTDGLPLISYCSGGGPGDYGLKVAHCDDVACTSATVTTVSDACGHTSITIGADGLGLISYTAAGLKVAHCDDLACSSATLNLVDSLGAYGYTSVAIGADGLPLISYLSSDDLLVAHCRDLDCTAADITVVANNVGEHTSITIGADGLGLIGFHRGAMSVVHCDNLACSSSTENLLSGLGGRYPSITIGADGLPLISSYDDVNNWLWVGHCPNPACALGASTTIVDNAGNVGLYTSITIGADGLGLISYYDATNGALKVAHCRDLDCTAAGITTLDSTGWGVGQYTSITIGADGLPLISYYDDTLDGALKVFHCGSLFCTPYFRRR